MATHQKIIQTEAKIKQAFIVLVKAHGFDHLTISAITKQAHINRSTFYAHYQDKFALRDHYTHQIINDIDRIMTNNLSATMQFQPTGRTTPQIYPIVLKVVRYLASEFNLVQVLLSPNGDPKLAPQLRSLLDQTLATDLYLKKGTSQLTPLIPEKYARTIVVAGIFDVIALWLQQVQPESPTEIAKIVMQTRYLSPYDLLGIDD